MTTRETEPCNAPCTRCFGSQRLTAWGADYGDDAHVEDCPCVEMQRLPDHRRPAQRWSPRGSSTRDDDLPWDLLLDDEAPRTRRDVAHLPDAPDWWIDHRRVTVSDAGRMRVGDTFSINGASHRVVAVDDHTATFQVWRSASLARGSCTHR